MKEVEKDLMQMKVTEEEEEEEEEFFEEFFFFFEGDGAQKGVLGTHCEAVSGNKAWLRRWLHAAINP